MEELYELVEKDIVTKLKEENSKLKQQVEKQYLELKNINSLSNSKLIEEIVVAFNEEAQKERKIISQTLLEIKEINKSTLDNVILKTENLDLRLEDMIKTLQELIVSISELAEEFKIKDSKIDLKNNIINSSEDLSVGNGFSNEEIKLKLENIEKFMNNLKILLSQIKPSDIVIETKAEIKK